MEYEAPNVTLALVAPSAIGRELAPLPGGTIAFRVPDVEAAQEELARAGVEFPAGVIDSGVCRIGPSPTPTGTG